LPCLPQAADDVALSRRQAQAALNRSMTAESRARFAASFTCARLASRSLSNTVHLPLRWAFSDDGVGQLFGLVEVAEVEGRAEQGPAHPFSSFRSACRESVYKVESVPPLRPRNRAPKRIYCLSGCRLDVP
jgi:hypothetical protein